MNFTNYLEILSRKSGEYDRIGQQGQTNLIDSKEVLDKVPEKSNKLSYEIISMLANHYGYTIKKFEELIDKYRDNIVINEILDGASKGVLTNTGILYSDDNFNIIHDNIIVTMIYDKIIKVQNEDEFNKTTKWFLEQNTINKKFLCLQIFSEYNVALLSESYGFDLELKFKDDYDNHAMYVENYKKILKNKFNLTLIPVVYDYNFDKHKKIILKQYVGEKLNEKNTN